jgi:hypothetical protein
LISKPEKPVLKSQIRDISVTDFYFLGHASDSSQFFILKRKFGFYRMVVADFEDIGV